ncbi:MAG: hypothetical protein JW915_03175 [Chitinispirillaceae bacterium]|nr:hypothetical protein [Chitinispirillaceae bacterium]
MQSVDLHQPSSHSRGLLLLIVGEDTSKGEEDGHRAQYGIGVAFDIGIGILL